MLHVELPFRDRHCNRTHAFTNAPTLKNGKHDRIRTWHTDFFFVLGLTRAASATRGSYRENASMIASAIASAYSSSTKWPPSK